MLKIVIVLMMCLLSAPVGAQNYRKEVTVNVVDPCFLWMMNDKGLATLGLSPTEVVEMVKATVQPEIEAMMKEILPNVRGKSEGNRMAIYAFALNACKKGVSRERRKQR